MLIAMAVAAPVLATDRPWLSHGPDGFVSPILRHLLGMLLPEGSTERAVLPAPIPYDPAHLDLDAVLEPPSRRHWMGTDGLGRDVVARLLHGARVSLSVGILTAGLALLIGLPLGALAGYRGGWLDAVVSRLIEAVLCFPILLLALAILGMSPPWLSRFPDVLRIPVVLAVAAWTPVARYLRGEFLRIRDLDMIAAARASGAGHLRVVARHILPSAMAPVLVTTTFMVGGAILAEAALSFIGLGVQAPTPTWGGAAKGSLDAHP